MNPAIDKAFSGDAEKCREGGKESEKLRGKDEVVPFIIGDAYQIEYDCAENPEDTQKAVEEYKRIVNGGYVFAVKNIQDLGARLGN